MVTLEDYIKYLSKLLIDNPELSKALVVFAADEDLNEVHPVDLTCVGDATMYEVNSGEIFNEEDAENLKNNSEYDFLYSVFIN